MSIVQNLAENTMQTIVQELKLKETGSAENPFRTLRSPMSPHPVGKARLFQGAGGEQLVYIGLTVPMIHLDSHMVFCFTGPESSVPHFTVDAVQPGDYFAFHLDMIPRVDLAVNLPYLKTVYQPLTEAFKTAKAIPGLSEAQLSPLQLAVMSPWMLAHRATAGAMDAVGSVVSQYLTHWLELYRQGIPIDPSSGQDLAGRDRVHRSVLFNREVDPVWAQVERLLGHEQSEELRTLLSGSH